MQIFGAIIPATVFSYFNDFIVEIDSYKIANQSIEQKFNIINFFSDEKEYLDFIGIIKNPEYFVSKIDRAEYGDFQTNLRLAKDVLFLLKTKGADPEIIIEPTCGKGNFIVASLSMFDKVKNIFGIEIYKQYVWEAKFNIIEFYLIDKNIKIKNKIPKIEIFHYNVFDFNFNTIANDYNEQELLVVGNPPWVTTAHLSSLESSNFPKKVNFKNHAGFDAMTGKGNFDISEYISIMIFNAFHKAKGNFSFLLKNSVIKNLIMQQKQHKYHISFWEKLTIDSKQEFNVSVDASMFYGKFNEQASFVCAEADFYNPSEAILQFGWVADKFVSNTAAYTYHNDIDGICPFEWRQGVKHDLSSIMELEKINDYFINGINEEIELEDNLLFPFLKSSDLKKIVITNYRKFTIITQKNIGDPTDFIQKTLPKTYLYLTKHQSLFNARKSSIYNGKPPFSIFGVGDYSFTPYKIAISGLYKKSTFSLILPQESKPVMLDDTCYLLGFDNLEFAAYTLILLNSPKAKLFLQSITFPDAKRMFTKEVLMRIDLFALSQHLSPAYIQGEIDMLIQDYELPIRGNQWEEYLKIMHPPQLSLQMSLF